MVKKVEKVQVMKRKLPEEGEITQWCATSTNPYTSGEMAFPVRQKLVLVPEWVGLCML